MKKRIISIIVVLVFLFISVQTIVTPKSYADDNDLCTFALYVDPIIPEDCNGKYNTFLIDFRATETPNNTYWELCGWGMDLTYFKSQYYNIKNSDNDYEPVSMGAYAGLQHTYPEGEKKAIMSFWQYRYTTDEAGKNEKILQANCMYPEKEGEFGGEGERNQQNFRL